MTPLTAETADQTAREIVELGCEHVHRRSLDFETFLVGVTLEDPTAPRAALDEWRSAVKRRAGVGFYQRWGGRRDVKFRRPDVVFVWDVKARELEVRVTPVYVYGRYVKLTRDLPQTRWHCKRCRGSGCKECGRTGRMHASSVEEVVGGPLAAAHGSEPPVLHGMGREDLDVRTLAPGRPFVVELKEPRSRKADLDALARTIVERSNGQVELGGPLRYVGALTVARLKLEDPSKRYRARVRASAPLDQTRVAALAAAFTGSTVKQKTPSRVLRRRADLVRERRVLALEARVLGPAELELQVLAEAGTYIKELVSGDEGRTEPSVAAFLGVAASVVELDVLEVLVDEKAVLGDLD